MKHLLIYTAILLVVSGFIIYKLIERIFNWVCSISNLEERVNYQLNIFNIERQMLKKLKL
jgi:hypothetical protein